MPFRKRQILHINPYFRPAISMVVLEDDKVVEKPVNTTQDLPSPDDFRVDVLLQAGVPVKQVGTSIIKPGFAETQDFLDSVKSSDVSSKSSGVSLESSDVSSESSTTNKE